VTYQQTGMSGLPGAVRAMRAVRLLFEFQRALHTHTRTLDTKSSIGRQWRYGSRGAVEPVWENGLAAWAGKVSHRLKVLRGVGMGQRIIVPKETIRTYLIIPCSIVDKTTHTFDLRLLSGREIIV
jgi:hypothetical protein